MNIEDIMTPDPICCTKADSVKKAAIVMREMDCGIVPIIDDEQSKRLVGVVTDRDLAIRVLAEGKDGDNVRLEECMSTDLVSCQSDDDLTVAMDMMKTHQVRRIPVVNKENQIIGIIATADVVLCGDIESREFEETMEEISEPHVDDLDAFAAMRVEKEQAQEELEKIDDLSWQGRQDPYPEIRGREG